MKPQIIIIVLLLLTYMAGCTAPASKIAGKAHPEWSLRSTIYELNTRQFTSAGTFNAAARELPRLKELGVDIIWVMPIQPIGILERKGELGSYYAIRDYTAINPEFGTMDDFKAFVEAAHKLGLKVIMDWVANHTSPDAVWIGNDGWHVRDSLGNTIGPYDWTDVAKLDYTSKEMRREMIDAMKFWVENAGVDGFRCDVAGEVPTDFWNDAVSELQALRPDIFMLAEAEVPELQQQAFDMYYGWEIHNIMNNIAIGKENADSLRSYFMRHQARFKSGFPMLFTSNHDENSWNGTEFERMGAAAKTFAALTYVLPGMPLIYNGQEVGFDRRLEFFYKDSIDWVSPNEYTAMYKSLNDLREANPALWSGTAGGKMVELATGRPSDVFALMRRVKGNTVVAVFNLSGQEVRVALQDKKFDGKFTDYAGGGAVTIKPGNALDLPAWGYKIYVK